jgi:hypothetical protein
MTTATVTVTCNENAYTQVTTASTGYALIYNPLGSGANVSIYNGSAAPDPFTQAKMVLKPDQAFQRTSDITDIIWVKVTSGKDIEIAVTE